MGEKVDLLVYLAKQYVPPHLRATPSGQVIHVEGYTREVATWAGEPFVTSLRKDMSPLKDRRNYIARIAGGSFHSGNFQREFVQGKPWKKTGEYKLSNARVIERWVPQIPSTDGLYEMQTFRPDPNGKLPPMRTRSYFVVEDGIVREVDMGADDPDELQEIIDRG